MKLKKQQQILVLAIILTFGIAISSGFVQPVAAQLGFDIEDIILFLQTINPYGTVAVETEALLVEGGFRIIITNRNTMLVYMVNFRNESESGFLFDLPVAMDGWAFIYPVSDIYKTVGWMFPGFFYNNLQSNIRLEGTVNYGFYAYEDDNGDGILTESYGPTGNYTEAKLKIMPLNWSSMTWGNLTPIEEPYFSSNPTSFYTWNVSYDNVYAELYNATWTSPRNPDDTLLDVGLFDHINYLCNYTYDSVLGRWNLKRTIELGAFTAILDCSNYSIATFHEHFVGRIKLETTPVTGSEGTFDSEYPYLTTLQRVLPLPFSTATWDMTQTVQTYTLGGVPKVANSTYYLLGELGLQLNLTSDVFYAGNLEITGNLSIYSSFICYNVWGGATISHDPTYSVPIFPVDLTPNLIYLLIPFPVQQDNLWFIVSMVFIGAFGVTLTIAIVKSVSRISTLLKVK
jgi:hypothetical protein